MPRNTSERLKPRVLDRMLWQPEGFRDPCRSAAILAHEPEHPGEPYAIYYQSGDVPQPRWTRRRFQTLVGAKGDWEEMQHGCAWLDLGGTPRFFDHPRHVREAFGVLPEYLNAPPRRGDLDGLFERVPAQREEDILRG